MTMAWSSVPVKAAQEKLRSANFEISAVHNHLIDETPRVMYMHYMGHGGASQLASSLRVALAVSKTPLEKPAAAAEEPAPPAWVKGLGAVVYADPTVAIGNVAGPVSVGAAYTVMVYC